VNGKIINGRDMESFLRIMAGIGMKGNGRMV